MSLTGAECKGHSFTISAKPPVSLFYRVAYLVGFKPWDRGVSPPELVAGRCCRRHDCPRHRPDTPARPPRTRRHQSPPRSEVRPVAVHAPPPARAPHTPTDGRL